jgi:hypothetical protein
VTGLVDIDGPAAPPRRNGALAFDAPWQGRVFGLAAAIVASHLDGDREPFRQHLIAAIAAEPERPYWDSWAAAVEALATDLGLIAPTDLATLPTIDADTGAGPQTS